MFLQRLFKFISFPIVTAFLFLALGYALDRAYSALSQNINCLINFGLCWLAHIALSSLFAIATWLYIVNLASTRVRKSLVLLSPLAIGIPIILWPFLGRLLLSDLSILRSVRLIADLHLALSSSGPASYLTLSALLVVLGVPLSVISARRANVERKS
jgi:hypothetical protein